MLLFLALFICALTSIAAAGVKNAEYSSVRRAAPTGPAAQLAAMISNGAD